MSLKTLLCLAVIAFEAVIADYLFSDAEDASGRIVPSYTPGRPPAVPLAVRSPYLNAWSTTANNSTLNSESVFFYPGNSLGWDGMVAVDGTTY